jgi:alpha-galactosidase
MFVRKTGAALVVVALTAINTFAADKPLKVYILSGQSNMQGKARVETLQGMAADPVSKDLYSKLVDADGKPRVFEDVRVAALTGGKEGDATKNGPLTVGFGGGLGETETTLGSELAFGATLYEKIKEPILIIKASWGGKSLNTDFRSPSAGPYYPFPDKVQDRKGNSGNLITAKEQIEGKVAKTGVYYRKLLEHVKTVLADPKKYHPAYDPKNGYELAGFVWLQGWNDMVDSGTYPGKGDDQYSEYTQLMAHFIRDVRKDLGAPKMPFVIDVLGVGGATDGPFQKAQAAAADLPEFKGNVMAVLMGKYWDHKLGELDNRHGAVTQKGKNVDPKVAELREKIAPLQNELAKLTGRDAKEKRKEIEDQMQAIIYTKEEQEYLRINRSNAGFHYLGSAKIYSRVGEATAEAMAKLVK